jgi:hypothetical protein
MSNTNIEAIKEKLELKKITEEQVQYFYMNSQKYCCDYDIDCMYHTIKEYEFLKPVKRLAYYYKHYFPKLYLRNRDKFKNMGKEPIYIEEYNDDMDQIVLQYSKCFKNMLMLILWPTCNINKNIKETNFYKLLEQHATVHAIKKVTLSYKEVQGSINQIYYDKDGFRKFDRIKEKQKNTMSDNNENKFHIILFIPNEHDKITGTNAPLKKVFRENLMVESEITGISENMFLHCTDNFRETVELSQLFFHKTSVKLLNIQRMDRFLNPNNEKSAILLMTHKNWLYKNIKLVDQMRFLIFSSMVLYSLGTRRANDLDLIIYHNPPCDENIKYGKCKTDNFIEKVLHFYYNKETSFDFVDFHMKGYDGWVEGGEKEYLNDWFEKEWPSMYGSKSLHDTMFNPNYHYYFHGVKVISFMADIARRVKRARAAAYADLIGLQVFNGLRIKIPPVPKHYWVNHVEKEYTPEDIERLIRTIMNYLYHRYHLKYTKSDVLKYISITK